MKMKKILKKALDRGDLHREEISFLLSLSADEDIRSLQDIANQVRKDYVGDQVHIRGLMEFSNICLRNCNYCGLRRDNHATQRYRMKPDEIVDSSVKVAKKGIKTIVLQSGEDPWFTASKIAEIIMGIKSQSDCAITLSIGERSFEDYQIMKEAGADRYLLRHETANPQLYSQLHPDSNFDNRQRCLKWLRELGYQVGVGCMVGLPGQTIEHLADDIEYLRDFQPDMAGIGPFIPHPKTPLGHHAGGTLKMTLKMVALTRIVTRNTLIPATTAIGSISEFGREMALEAGADVVMPNYTPLKYRINYEIYPNKRCINEDPDECHGCMQHRITGIGRFVGKGQGHSRKVKQ